MTNGATNQGQPPTAAIVTAGDPYTESTVNIQQKAFPFCQADFEILTSSDISNVAVWGLAFISGDFGYFISVFPEFISPFLEGDKELSGTQWLTLLLFLLIGVALWVWGKFGKSKKNGLTDRIENHFKTNPPKFIIESVRR